MRPRQNLVDLFSSFIQFADDRFQTWVSDPKLRRNMNRSLSQSATHLTTQPTIQPTTQPTTQLATSSETPPPEPAEERSEQFWVVYWWKAWQAQPQGMGQEHLAAYLQEVCYWTAQKTITGFRVSQYTLSDCFQVAIVRLDKILRGFNPNQSNNLKIYAGIAFGGLIREFLRQRRVVDICSDWALLRKISQKRLIAALKSTPLAAAQIPAYVLAWRCFKAVHVPTQATSTRSLPKPTDTVWQAVAAHYNRERSQLVDAPMANAAQIEQWMQVCVKAARAYLYPATVSINAPRGSDDTGEWLDSLTDDSESLLTTLIAEEEQQTRQTQQAQINDVLTQALATIDPSIQQLLQLYYGQGLTQQQMAKELDMKQYTISRRFSKARELLLARLATWSHETFDVPQTQDLLNTISPVLEEWLVIHYQRSDINEAD